MHFSFYSRLQLVRHRQLLTIVKHLIMSRLSDADQETKTEEAINAMKQHLPDAHIMLWAYSSYQNSTKHGEIYSLDQIASNLLESGAEED